MSRELVALVGLPGSGKTSFRMRHPQWVVVSKDDIRRTVFHCDYDPAYEDAVERIFAATLIEVVESQAPVVCVDNTNLTRAERQSLVEVARLAHREPIAHVMPFEPLGVVYARKQEALRALARDPSGVKVNGFPCDCYEAIYRRYEEVCEDEGFVRILREAIPLALRRETRRARRPVSQPEDDLVPLPLFVP
jgi:predicted kinase